MKAPNYLDITFFINVLIYFDLHDRIIEDFKEGKREKMVWFVLVVGYTALALCLAILIAPKVLRRIVDFFSIGSRLYLAGLLRIVLGIVLLILASQSRLWGYVVTLGLLASASGLSIFFFALRRTKKILQRLRNQSNLILRLFAIGAFAIWALLVYSLSPAIPALFPR